MTQRSSSGRMSVNTISAMKRALRRDKRASNFSSENKKALKMNGVLKNAIHAENKIKYFSF